MQVKKILSGILFVCAVCVLPVTTAQAASTSDTRIVNKAGQPTISVCKVVVPAGKTCASKNYNTLAAGKTAKAYNAFYVGSYYGYQVNSGSWVWSTPRWQNVTAGKTSTVTLKKTAAYRILGKPQSGLPWHSGAWLGGRAIDGAANAAEWGAWRGRPLDLVDTYSPTDSYDSIANNTWSITTWSGFKGKLQYGLASIPGSTPRGDYATRKANMAKVARGDYDKVWQQVARNLRTNGRGDSVVRIAWEANYSGWAWASDYATAPTYKAHFRRIVQVMRREAPQLKFEFDIGCGTALAKSPHGRLSSLTDLYPGDDVVDIVSCNIFDWWTMVVTKPNDPIWLRPSKGPGLLDVAEFARKHGKGMGIPEWSLARTNATRPGGDDNTLTINLMSKFLKDNRDVVAYENYFDETDPSNGGSIHYNGIETLNPNAAKLYRSLW